MEKWFESERIHFLSNVEVWRAWVLKQWHLVDHIYHVNNIICMTVLRDCDAHNGNGKLYFKFCDRDRKKGYGREKKIEYRKNPIRSLRSFSFTLAKLTRWTSYEKKAFGNFFFLWNRCQLKIYAFDGGFSREKKVGRLHWKLPFGNYNVVAHLLLKWNYIDFNYKSVEIQFNRQPKPFHHYNINPLCWKPETNSECQ